RAAFVGLTESHTRGHLTRAVMEGVAFSLRDSFEIFRELGAPMNSIRLGGGGAQSQLWQQIQADVYGQPVTTIEVDEGAAFGAALLAGVGYGAWGSVDEACDMAIKTMAGIKPQPTSVRPLDRNYAAYKLLYPALKPAMNIINNFED
ncbi:MAG: FGGY-family carbohydrate kinase, partial [Acidobacteriota bacterium]